MSWRLPLYRIALRRYTGENSSHRSGTFGATVLERLVDRGEDEVVGVFAPPERRGRPDPLSAKTEELGVPLVTVTSMRTDEVYSAIVEMNADIGVMAFVTLIVPERVLNAPRLGTIQYHPSLLPRHRGASAINWAIINGEDKTGLTIFWPDKGLDTGPILMQRETAIGPDDTVGSLYFNRLFPEGVDAMIESVDMVKAGTAPRIIQDESKATYEASVAPRTRRSIGPRTHRPYTISSEARILSPERGGC